MGGAGVGHVDRLAFRNGRRAGGRRRLSRDAGRHRDDGSQIGQIRGHYQGCADLRQLAELLHIFFADTQLHGFDAAAVRQCDAHLPQTLRGRGRDGQNRLRLTFGFVDLLLLVGFGLFDHALLVAFRGIDLGVALAFGGQHDCAFLALGAHLLFHGGQHVLRRRDVLDFVAQYLHAPGGRCLVQLGNDIRDDGAARLERSIQLDFADLAAQRGLRQLRNRKSIVGDSVRGEVRVHHLHIQHAVHAHLDIVAGDADLLGDVDGDFLQAVLVGYALHEGHQDVKAGGQRTAVLAEVLDDVGALLRNHGGGLCDYHHDEYGDNDGSVAQRHIHEALLTTNVTPSTRSTRARPPASIGDSPPFTAVQVLPRNSRRQLFPGARSVGSTNDSPTGAACITGRLRRRRSYTRRRKVTMVTTVSAANISHCSHIASATPARARNPTTRAAEPTNTR